MKRKFYILTLMILFSSCNKEFFSPENTPKAVVETLWEYADENYVYFDYKNINWDLQKNLSVEKASETISEDSLFSICKSLLAILKDGHCFLGRRDELYRYDYANSYEVHFDLNLVKEKYLNNDFQTKGFYTFGIIQDTIGYVYFEKFSKGFHFPDLMEFFKEEDVSKIIIDLRNNSGGDPKIAQNMAGFFVEDETLVGYITHKSGKEHHDFSSKIELYALPQASCFDKEVKVLLNRKSYSASSYFAGMVDDLPNVELIGQITGGGGGAAAAYELPNGWTVGITSNFFEDSKDRQIENGVIPGLIIENSAMDTMNQIDRMLEKAIMN